MSQPAAQADATMKTILIALSRPEMIRIVLNTDTYEVLRRQPGLRFVILAPEPDDAELVATFGGPNVVFEQLNDAALHDAQRGNRLKYALSAIRLYTYNEAGRNEPMARDVIVAEQKELAARGRRDPLARLYYWFVFNTHRLLGRSRLLRRLWVAAETRIVGSDFHPEVYRRHRPDAVLVSSVGYGPDLYLIREAKRHGAKVFSVVKSWDNPTTRGYPGALVDRVAAWSSVMRDELDGYLDIPRERVEVCGVPYWDDYFGPLDIGTREEFLAKAGLRPDRRTVYYPTSTPRNYRENMTVARTLCEAIRDGHIAGPVQLLVRPHPGYWQLGKVEWERINEIELAELRALQETYADVMRIDWPDIKVYGNQANVSRMEALNLRQKFSFCDVMVANYSTQAIEAAVFDLPIVNIGFGNYKRTSLPNAMVDNFPHYRRVLATGALVNAYDEQTMIEAVNAYLKDRSLHRDGRRRLLDQEIPVNRGTAGRFVGEMVLRALGLEPTATPAQEAAE